MNVNGRNELACLKYVVPSIKPIVIRQLPNADVLKDLVPDLTNFYNQHKAIEPWLQRWAYRSSTDKEIIQSIAHRKKLDGLYECILCACCTTACPPYWWNSEAYLGPAALLNAFRWISDSRDELTRARLAWLNDSLRLYRCHGILNCTEVCPKHLDPAQAIREIKAMIATDFEVPGEWNKRIVQHTLKNEKEERSGLSMS
jgi:succinate dehydrogenase (ubiquinone) iron-sulfur subunit